METMKTEKISIRLSKEEIEIFDEEIKKMNLNRSAALRKVVRKISGFIEPDTVMLKELRDLNRQIVGIARNLNQLTIQANKGNCLIKLQDLNLFKKISINFLKKLNPHLFYKDQRNYLKKKLEDA